MPHAMSSHEASWYERVTYPSEPHLQLPKRFSDSNSKQVQAKYNECKKKAAATLIKIAAGNMCAVQLATLTILMSKARVQCDMHGER